MKPAVTSHPTAASKILFADTSRWACAARIAVGLSRAGAEISAVCPAYGHPLLKSGVLRHVFRYGSLRPLESLRVAIERAGPDFIIPCDERSVQHLHELHAMTLEADSSARYLRELIERSLGPPASYPIVASRKALLALARERGLPVPAIGSIASLDDLRSFTDQHGFPCVLKANGTSGGRGVRIAHTAKEAEQFFGDMLGMFWAGRAIKRLIVNRDPFWVRPWWNRLKPSIIAQTYINGRPANCAVACWQGKVLAGICVEVIASQGLTGPANAVRIVEGKDMMLAAEKLASQLGLSGFFGLDFMIENATELARLIEMNPRSTPLCHLQLGEGRDMVAALWAQLSGQPLRVVPPITNNNLIAYFPQSPLVPRELLSQCYLDVPQGQPELEEELLRPWPDRSLIARVYASVSQRMAKGGSHQPELVL
jgi:hypothetical protein